MMGGNVAWLATGSLARREVVRFLRQPARLIGAIAMPLIFWLMIGAGMGDSFRPSGISSEGGFLHYFFPGIVVLCVLFSAIYSTISIIEDRDAGFLQDIQLRQLQKLPNTWPFGCPNLTAFTYKWKTRSVQLRR